VSVGIKAENGGPQADKVTEAFEEWVFAFRRNRKDET
jgi:hypothetical protein